MKTDSFESLSLNPRILAALKEVGYSEPTEIQSAVIPLAIDGQDILGAAQTGTGKTAAFVLPILERMAMSESENELERGMQAQPSEGDAHDQSDSRGKRQKKRRNRFVRALILSPTRELAQQIEENVEAYAKFLPFNVLSVVGGLSIQRQIKQIQKGVDILVATPGRLLDLLYRKQVDLRRVEYFVLDEADRMLDMGFVHDVQDIAKKIPKERQTFFFSATTSGEVGSLARVLLQNPQTVAVHPPDTVNENVESQVLFVERRDKRELILELVRDPEMTRVLIFTATKSDANVLAAILSRQDIATAAIHSDKSQRDRQQALRAFDSGENRVLVATDVMARGIDVEGISHVINYDLPGDPENFVHRIGRTARAGSRGIALSLCDLDEVKALHLIESFIGSTLDVDREHAFHSKFVETMKNRRESPFAKKRSGRGGSRGRGRRGR
ncbi:DEAD/DEAH box helicase [bacterium]|jgi:ATP-dependent RNA helicase RhlE|nr:DEAD/DEAH box helicase [bacterium]